MNRRAEPHEPNPWVTAPAASAVPAAVTSAQRQGPSYMRLGPSHPLERGVDPLSRGGLGFRRTDLPDAAWWWVGCHGGAGASTLSAAVPGGAEPGEPKWPVHTTPCRVRVLLVARTHARGLHAAQEAATQWASGAVPHVDLLGLVAVADAPGKLPRPLRDALRFVAGGVPRLWHVPWIEAWRLGQAPHSAPRVRAVVQLAADLARLAANSREVP